MTTRRRFSLPCRSGLVPVSAQYGASVTHFRCLECPARDDEAAQESDDDFNRLHLAFASILCKGSSQPRRHAMQVSSLRPALGNARADAMAFRQ